MVATVKIIPYAVAGPELARAVRRLATASAGALRLHPFRPGRAALILTATPGMKASLLAKGAEVVRARLSALGQTMAPPVTVAHETAAVAAAIAAAEADLVLILGASATSDAADTCPAALVAAGGRLIRFGMPVDPGNLLFLGEHGHRPVVGLPGCARSPALNGADWVLERLAAGLAVSSVDIGQMGVGGLLKEIASRPQPRVGRPRTSTPPRVAALVLAAGAARRMRGRDKLLEVVDGRPLLRAVAEAALTSRAASVLVVLPPDLPARTDALAGLAVDIVEAPDWAEGMAASIRAGLAAAEGSDAVVLLLADMPAIGRTEIDRLIAAFDPKRGARYAVRSAPTARRATRCCSVVVSSRRCTASRATRARERCSATRPTSWLRCGPRAVLRWSTSIRPRTGRPGAQVARHRVASRIDRRPGRS